MAQQESHKFTKLISKNIADAQLVLLIFNANSNTMFVISCNLPVDINQSLLSIKTGLNSFFASLWSKDKVSQMTQLICRHSISTFEAIYLESLRVLFKKVVPAVDFCSLRLIEENSENIVVRQDILQPLSS